MRLLLIRHGQTIDNVNGALGTARPGPGLTALGEEQAAAVPAALAAERIDAVYVSTLVRTHLTAAPLAAARGLEVQQIDGLQEITAGELEGRSDAEAIGVYLGTLFAWWSDPAARIPGGESGEEFRARFDGAIARIAREHGEGTVAVFSHGAAIRSWTAFSSDDIDAAFSRSHGLENTGTVILEGSPGGRWSIISWQGTPLGGLALEDESAPDPTAEAVD